MNYRHFVVIALCLTGLMNFAMAQGLGLAHIISGLTPQLLEEQAAAQGQANLLLKTENFDRDPGWDANNNRSNNEPPANIRQDFGYSATSHAGGKAGEIGGVISPAGEPAYYAKVIPAKTLSDTLTASESSMWFRLDITTSDFSTRRASTRGGRPILSFCASSVWRTAPSVLTLDMAPVVGRRVNVLSTGRAIPFLLARGRRNG